MPARSGYTPRRRRGSARDARRGAGTPHTGAACHHAAFKRCGETTRRRARSGGPRCGRWHRRHRRSRDRGECSGPDPARALAEVSVGGSWYRQRRTRRTTRYSARAHRDRRSSVGECVSSISRMITCSPLYVAPATQDDGKRCGWSRPAQPIDPTRTWHGARVRNAIAWERAPVPLAGTLASRPSRQQIAATLATLGAGKRALRGRSPPRKAGNSDGQQVWSCYGSALRISIRTAMAGGTVDARGRRCSRNPRAIP